MLRRNIRKRKEYLHQRNKRRKDDSLEEKHKSLIDNEYARAGITDPVVFITTSREPSARLRKFAKELSLIIPNAQRINRGKMTQNELMETCQSEDITDLVIAHEHRGTPDALIVCHLPYGPTAYFGLMNVVLRHDVKIETHAPQAFPHLIFDNMTTPLGERVTDILKYLFPVPKEESTRVVSFVNKSDYLSMRHHVFKSKDEKEVDLEEVGPRFEMKLFQIKLGRLDHKGAQNEFVLRPYMNTASVRNYLGE